MGTRELIRTLLDAQTFVSCCGDVLVSTCLAQSLQGPRPGPWSSPAGTRPSK